MASNQAGNPAVGGAVPYRGPAVAVPPRSIPAGRRTAREGTMVVDAASGEVLGGTLQQVYVYETPVRIWHWVMMVAMIVLVATGYLIGSPWSGPTREATFTYFFGNIRLVHFLAAAVFLVAFVIRVYWAIAGNHHARSIFLPPVWSRELVGRDVPPGAVLRVHQEGIAAVDRAQPARAVRDVRDVRARHHSSSS